MRGAWLTGGPCWLRLCENSISPPKDVLDVRQNSGRSVQRSISESSVIRPVLQTTVPDALFVYGKETNHSFTFILREGRLEVYNQERIIL